MVFGVSYLIFQNKLKKVIDSIPIVENKEFEKMNKEKIIGKINLIQIILILILFMMIRVLILEDKLIILIPKLIKDTVVKFLFSSSITYNSFKECYWECLYFHAVNRYNFLPGKKQFDWHEITIMRKYKLSKDDYWKIIDIVKNSSSISK